MSDGYRILVGPPGPNFSWGCVRGLLSLTSSKHEVKLINSGNGFDDFDTIWATALNEGEAGRITHVAMLHLDIVPESGDNGPIWLDVLVEEMDRLGLDYISAVSALKDGRGLTSTGIGDPNNPWSAYRRFTLKEICALPETFTAADAGYLDKPLLHNSGCWLADMRKPMWYKADANGDAPAHFAFPERVFRDPQTGMWQHARESEDWFFSRCLFKMGAKTAVTRKVKLSHIGKAGYPNWMPWGEWEHDWQTAGMWNTPAGPWDEVQGWFDFADLYQSQVNRVNGRPAKFVEVGSWFGKSTLFLADAVRKSGKNIAIDAVDTWCGGTKDSLNGQVNDIVDKAGGSVYERFLGNLNRFGVRDIVTPVVSDSAKAADNYANESVDFVFIDADHTAAAVARDLRAWWPKVRPGGVLAGHDLDEDGVKEATAEFAGAVGRPLKRCGMSFVFEKPANL